ncbi:type VI secretion system ImpA family N-terminal domain-containing protein [Pseudomonas trivialis]|uniref:type VI secretion system ImpA family N-terminal domain-containing protein n=1 Tax=Pseudomonas TaxID=286 RepID=UPI0026AD273B|nr:type VI secretion system ImpA family N-terminal domain-containing protein [Pseudomonas trivialis]
MTALFEMRIRVGGDPRGFSEFTVLRDELAKLSHPACPDVDWAKVEQSCLVLFQHNGADLQTACFSPWRAVSVMGWRASPKAWCCWKP